MVIGPTLIKGPTSPLHNVIIVFAVSTKSTIASSQATAAC